MCVNEPSIYICASTVQRIQFSVRGAYEMMSASFQINVYTYIYGSDSEINAHQFDAII